MSSLKLSFGVLLCCLLGVVFSQSTESADEVDENFRPSTIIPLPMNPAPRIVGGRNAEDAQFPYQISLRYRNSHICGGAIISPTFIVTAAHCVKDGNQVYAPSTLSILAGSTFVHTGGVTVPVAEVIPHPNYRNYFNDIALLRLSAPLNFTQRIRAIALANEDTPAGSEVVASGWGRLRTGGSRPTHLQYVKLNAISHDECQRMIGKIPQYILCLVSRGGLGICQGDSGGPAAYNNQLIGVTNFVVSRCGTSAPDGFASIYRFGDWIRQNSDL